MSKKYKMIFKICIVCIGVLIFTTPNEKLKDKYNINKVEISQNDFIKGYLNKHENLGGVSIIQKDFDNNNFCKNEEAYVIFKNQADKYYNSVNIIEGNNDIIISYSECGINEKYENNLYNTRVDDVMVLRIKSNSDINDIVLESNYIN